MASRTKSSSSRVVNVGFTQMRCVEDVATNRKHQAELRQLLDQAFRPRRAAASAGGRHGN